MTAPLAAASLPGDVSPDALLRTLLAISPTGILLLRPLYADADAARIVDFAWVQLNPAAQQQLGLAECPAESLLTLFPAAQATGELAFYRDAFGSGRAARYQAAGAAGHYQLVAQRQGPLLLVAFTEAGAPPHLAAEEALRQRQAREQAALAEAERQQLYQVLQQLPAQVTAYTGPDHVVAFLNARLAAYGPGAALLGRPVREAATGAVGEAVCALLDRVYTTGEVVQAHEVEVPRPAAPSVFLSTSYQPLRDGQGRIYGVLDFSCDVTAQVLARRQLEQLTQELEARVLARTAELSQQQRLLSQILGRVPAAIATLDGPTHRYGFVNERYQQLMAGRVRLGSPVAEVLPEAVAQGFVALLDQVYATGEPYVEEGRPAVFQDAPGAAPRAHYLDISYQRLLDGQGRPQGILAFVVDATQRVRDRQQAQTLQTALLGVAQRRAQERQDLLSLFAHAPVAVALLREPDHRLDYYNSRFDELYPGAQPGRPIAEVYPALVTAETLARLDRVYQTGESYHSPDTQLAGQPAAEPARYVAFTYQPYRETGQTVGIAVFVHEVTEQVRVRQQLEEQARLFRELYNQAPAAVCILRGPEFVVELANPAILRIWGLTAAQALGRPRLELLPETSRASLRAVLETPYRTGRTHHVQEFPVVLGRTESGQPDQGYFNFIYQPLFNEQGAPVALTCVGIEVTEQVLARQQVQGLNEELTTTNEHLQESNRQLTRTNVDLDTFVYTASHDLKAPITNIEGIVLALRETLPAPVQQEPMVAHLLGLLNHTVGRFLITINQLTDLVRLQRAHSEPAQLVALASTIEAVRLDLVPAIAAARAHLVVEVPAALQLSFSPSNLRSIVYNLLSNALKYRAAERPAEVRIRAAQLPGAVVLTVQDNGLGLSDDQQQRLFGLFQRLHTHVEGTGVGLYTIKRLIDNAGARIEVASQPGQGSTFTVTFPA